jgi:hypothetical protein
MVVSVAVVDGLPLHTCNPDDFTGIDGLVVFAVEHPDRASPQTRWFWSGRRVSNPRSSPWKADVVAGDTGAD